MNPYEAIGLFTRAGIHVCSTQSIPNEYWKGSNYDGSRLYKPWQRVMTWEGPIVIGWRKRVISIDWSETGIFLFDPIKFKRDDGFEMYRWLVPDDVTSGPGYIHAWSMAKAEEYLKVLKTHFTKGPHNFVEHQRRGNLKQDIAMRWAAKLRDPNLKQGRGCLHQISDTGESSFCCLGVLTDMFREEEGGEWTANKTVEGKHIMEYKKRNGYLSDSVREWAGMKGSMGQRKDERNSLSRMNDLGCTFLRIADIIEAEWEQL